MHFTSRQQAAYRPELSGIGYAEKAQRSDSTANLQAYNIMWPLTFYLIKNHNLLNHEPGWNIRGILLYKLIILRSLPESSNLNELKFLSFSQIDLSYDTSFNVVFTSNSHTYLKRLH